MKKLLRKTGITILSLFILFYIGFVFILPNVVNLNKYMPQLKQILSEQSNLIIDIENPKIVTTPLLAIGLKADKVSIKLPDNSEFVNTDKVIGRISLPHLLFFTLKISRLEIENPQINIDIVNGQEYKISKIIEKLTGTSENQNSAQNLENAAFSSSNIKLLVPKVKIENYSIKITDLKTKDFLKLQGNELLMGYKNGKSAFVKTVAELFVNEKKNITANIDIDTFLPNIASSDKGLKEQDKDYSFINPVAVYKAYDLKANIDSKIKIRQKNNKIESNGYFNIDKLTLNIGGIQLPEGKFYVTSKETNSKIDSELYVTEKEKMLLEGIFNYSKKPELQMKIKTDDIHLNNVIELVKAALASLNIQNRLDEIKGEGYFNADTEFKTNFSELESQGSITIYNCIVRNKKDNKRLSRVNSVISLDNSILKFVDTYIEILDAVFKIDGTIDETSKTDISVIMERMPVQKLTNLFIPAEIVKNYIIDSGNIDLTAKISGELKQAAADIKLSVKNFALTDKINNINYSNNLFAADFSSDFKTYNGKITNSDFRVIMNGLVANCDKFIFSVDDKNIHIEPSSVRINDETVINFDGEINNYVIKPEFKINADGKLKAGDIKQILGTDISSYIKEKGFLPLNISITGDNKNQIIKASIDADKDNYITFADISNVLNKETKLQTVIDLKSDSIQIKDTGLYLKEGENLEEIVSIDGTITKLNTANPSINLIKLKMPKELVLSISIFPKSQMTVKGSAFVSGDIHQPKIKGEFNISNMSIPELYLTMKKAMAKFEGKDLDIDIANLVANGSDFDILINADILPSETFIIRNLNLKSNHTDADKVVKVSEAAANYMSSDSSIKNTSDVKNAAETIPVVVHDGSIDMKQIKSGNIILTDTTAKLSFADNILDLNNLVTTALKGRISGNVAMNIYTGEMKATLKGSGLDVEQTLADAAAIKDTLTGTMDFNADISLKGTTYEEQMKTLKGDVSFTMKDGSLGPFAKLENLVAADNLKSIALLNSIVGSALKSTYDTSKYNTLKGYLIFNNGVAQINPITSVGDYMSAYIFGNFDILKNTADMKLRGVLSSSVSSSLGQLSQLNPINIIKNSSELNIILGQFMLNTCEAVTSDELGQIPALDKESTDANNLKFQVVIRGDAAQPAKLIRSFKWLALESEISEAREKMNISGSVSVPTDIDEVKQQAKEIVKGLFTVETQEKGTEDSSSLTNQLKETQKNVWQQLKEQVKQNESEVNPE